MKICQVILAITQASIQSILFGPSQQININISYRSSMKGRCLTETQSAKKNHYTFEMNDHKLITISSNFQSGNIRLVRQASPNIVPDHIIEYVLQAVSDVEGSSSKKSWFFFKMKASEALRVRVQIRNVNIYESSANKNLQCQPVFKVGCDGSWNSIPHSYFSNDEDPRLIFDYKLPKAEEVFFCISIPFTYSENQIYLAELENKISPQIYFKNELLVSTLENRDVRLLTISEYGPNNTEAQRKHKPVVLVTSRVHPGEVTSSFLLMGILEMLTENSLQSYLLRRLFEWKIVPMLNPDGVAAGNYRLDPQGCNLNRQYLEPDQVLHPASFKIIELMNQLSASSRRVEFYFDLHSHSSMKDGFIYGNALDDLIQQSYSQLFCKILEENNLWFKYSLCQFGEKHMKHKDKGEEKTKQGCGRVMALKIAGVVRSYTLETSMLPGYYDKYQKGMLKQKKNLDFEYLPAGYSSSLRNDQNMKKEDCFQNPMITVTRQLGRDVLISMLDMLQKNPYTRINNEYNRVVLRDLAQKLLQKEERFKIFDIHTYSKPKIAYKIVEDEIETTINDAWNRAGIANALSVTRWPEQFKLISCSLLPRNRLRMKLQSLRCRSQSKAENQIKHKILKKVSRLATQQEQSLQPYMSIDSSDIKIRKNHLLNSKGDKDNEFQIKYALKSSEKVDPSNCRIFYNLPVNLLSNAIIGHPNDKQIYHHGLINKEIIHNITPSMCLRNSAKSMAKERTQKKKVSIKNCYQASIEQRKRALTQLRSPLDHPSILPGGQLSSLHSVVKLQKDRSISSNQDKSKNRNNSKDLLPSLDKERESVKLPSMNSKKQQVFQGFLLRKGAK